MSSSFAQAAGLASSDSLGEEFRQQFNALFGDFEANAEKIKVELAKLVAWIARGIAMADREDSADFEGEVYSHVLTILPRYLSTRNDSGALPHDWFRKAINRKFWELTRHSLMVRKRSHSLDVDDEREIRAPFEHDRLAVVRAAKAQPSFKLKGEADAHITRRYLNKRISVAVRHFSQSDEPHLKHQLMLQIAGLQETRKTLLGDYKRVGTPGIQYNRRMRLHDIPPSPASTQETESPTHQTGVFSMSNEQSAAPATAHHAAPVSPPPSQPKRGKGISFDREERLSRILQALQGGTRPAGELGTALGVGKNAIRKDVQLLRKRGHQVLSRGNNRTGVRYELVASGGNAPTDAAAIASVTTQSSAKIRTAEPAKSRPQPVMALALDPKNRTRPGDILRALAAVLDLCGELPAA